MNLLTGIANEMQRVFDMTFIAPFRPSSGPRMGQGWMKDRHLRTGFFLALPVLILGIFLLEKFMPRSQPFLFLVAIASNFVWLAYAAWSRERATTD